MEPLRIELATPCSANWDEMSGDERKRFCGLCRKHVYDLSGLTRSEIHALLERPEGAPCVRFFQRADGTVLTADCPVGLRERARRLAWRAWAAAGALVLGVLGFGAAQDAEPELQLTPIARTVKITPQAAPQIPLLPSQPRRGAGGRTTLQNLITGERVMMGLRIRRQGTIQIIKGTAEAKK